MDYTEMNRRLEALTDGVRYTVANLANAAALLYGTLEDINWAGFYLAYGEKLILGPFQGKPACIEIPFGKGVCGTAVSLGQIQQVPDVHKFPGHIACDPDSRSELVIPLYRDGVLFGVMDIDSPSPNRFSPMDCSQLERFAHILEKAL